MIAVMKMLLLIGFLMQDGVRFRFLVDMCLYRVPLEKRIYFLLPF